MIKRIKFENFRSFVKAEAQLQPFTLVIGTNGAGKSNLLKWFQFVSGRVAGHIRLPNGGNRNGFIFSAEAWVGHIEHLGSPKEFLIEFSDGGEIHGDNKYLSSDMDLPWPKAPLPLFNLVPATISSQEKITGRPEINSDGGGTTQVLDALKSGDRIEANLRRYVPEVEKLSLKTENGHKVIQIRERGLKTPLPASELSEGTRLILCILTIIHQEDPPPVILLEDIDRGMHPRLFDQIAPLMRQIAEEHNINIIATTHNPYLVDAFQDAKECVLLVEKVDGASILVPLTERLKEMDYDEVESDMPLGQLWYSGLIGAVPQRQSK
jgi:predicted ATPase